MITPIKVVALFRISVDKKKRKKKNYVPNTFGIQAQHAIVHQVFSKPQYEIVKEYYEQGSGRKKHRPVLNEALKYCKENKCTLVVARQDRLTRRLVVVAGLLESDIDFRVALYPDLDPKKNQIIFLMQGMIDQLESITLSQRTEAAMHVKLAKGEKMGEYGKNVLSKRNHTKSVKHSLSKERLFSRLIRERGITSYNGLAVVLNELGEPTAKHDGSLWSSKTVRHVAYVIEQETGRRLFKSKTRIKLKKSTR